MTTPTTQEFRDLMEANLLREYCKEAVALYKEYREEEVTMENETQPISETEFHDVMCAIEEIVSREYDDVGEGYLCGPESSEISAEDTEQFEE